MAVCGSGTALGGWSVANALELDAGAVGLGKVGAFHVISTEGFV